MNKKILDELQPIFQDIFDDEELEITEETTADDIEDWDSMEHLHLAIAIEKINIKFAFDEMKKLKNVGEMVMLIDSKVS